MATLPTDGWQSRVATGFRPNRELLVNLQYRVTQTEQVAGTALSVEAGYTDLASER